MGMWKRFAARLQGGIEPNLVIAQRVIDKMKSAAQSYIEDETGEAMVGLVMPGENTNGVPTIYVLDTISPESDSTVRHFHTFQQGDAGQDELIYWLQMNWAAQREKRQFSIGKANPANGKWDVPLRYLGDWHKQPGYMIQPSGGDLMTALDWLSDEDNGMEFLLVPIVTLDHPATTIETDATVNYVSVPTGDGACMRVDFWYIDGHIRGFRPLTATVFPNHQLPELVDSYPWYLLHEDRYHTEINQLSGDGLFTSPPITWNVDQKLPLEICIMAGRVGTAKLIVFVTDWDYPNSAPRAYTMPFPKLEDGETMHDLFKRTWPNAQPAKNPPGWTWSADKYLLDYMHALEDAMGIERPQKKVEPAALAAQPAETPVSAPPDETELLPSSKVAEALAQAEARKQEQPDAEADEDRS